MTYKGRAPFPSAAFVETQRNFTYFDRSLTSGLTDVVIESPGDFLYIDQASTGVVSVELNMRQGGTIAPILLAAGGSIECDFSSIKLNANAQLSKTVRIIIGNGAKIKSGATVNPQSNQISVVDGSRYRSENNSAFMAYDYQPAVAAEQSYVQLWNPSTNTKNVFLEKMFCSAQSATNVVFGSFGTALTTNDGGAPSKKSGGAVSSAQLRRQSYAGGIGTVAMLLAPVSATPFQYEFKEPVMLPPGTGFNIGLQTANVFVVGGFEFFEE